MTRPKHTRRDANHAEIVDTLRALGAYVADTADLGGEVLDLLVCWRGRCLPVEVKAPGKRDELTEGEALAFVAIKSAGVTPVIATCAEDVLEAFGVRVR